MWSVSCVLFCCCKYIVTNNNNATLGMGPLRTNQTKLSFCKKRVLTPSRLNTRDNVIGHVLLVNCNQLRI